MSVRLSFGKVICNWCVLLQSMHSVLPAHLNHSEAGPITADELSTQDCKSPAMSWNKIL